MPLNWQQSGQKKAREEVQYSEVQKEGGREGGRGEGNTSAGGLSHRAERRGRAALFALALSHKSPGQLGCSACFKVWDGTTPLGTPPPLLPPLPLTFHPPPVPHPPQRFHLSSEPGTLHFLSGPMPASPPGNVFPALVVVGHIVTLIAVWQWRVRKKQGKTSLLLQGLREVRWPSHLKRKLEKRFSV